MKKDLGIIFGLFGFLIIIVVFARGFTSFNFLRGSQQATGAATSSANKSGRTDETRTDVKIKTLEISAQIAAKPKDRQKGLGKRDSLPLNEAMLFVFEKTGVYPIWMKDMRFAIDIIWIEDSRAGEKKIVDIAANVPPEPDKKDDQLTVYRPKGTALYILEINAGLSSLNNLQIGDTVEFEL